MPRVSMALTFLVILPWSIVIVADYYEATLDRPPDYDWGDVQRLAAIARAMDAYRSRYGSYPPDFTTGDPRREIDEHLASIFPQRDRERDIPPRVDQLGPDRALVFWLRGFYEDNSAFPLTGKILLGEHPETEAAVLLEPREHAILAEVYDGDAGELIIDIGRTGTLAGPREKLLQEHPELKGVLDTTWQRRSFYRFLPGRISNQGTCRLNCTAVPLVYFNAAHYGHASFTGNPAWGVARPYHMTASATTSTFVAPNRFQIICAGADGYFGSDASVVATNHLDGHADNLTSFGDKPVGWAKQNGQRVRAVLLRKWSPFVAILCSLIYPMVALMRVDEDGLLLLSQLVKHQITAVDCSESWRQQLAAQKRSHRVHALRRFTTRKP